MQPMRRPSCRIARSMVRPRPSTQKRRLFSRSALGMTGIHDTTCTDASFPPFTYDYGVPTTAVGSRTKAATRLATGSVGSVKRVVVVTCRRPGRIRRSAGRGCSRRRRTTERPSGNARRQPTPRSARQRPPREHSTSDQDRHIKINGPQMANRRDAVHIVQGQGQRHSNHRCEKSRPQSPSLPRANPTPGQRDHRYAEGNHECCYGDLKVTDVIVEVRAEGANLLGRPTDMFRREPEFDEACEIPDEEHDSIAHEPDASEYHEIGAQACRSG